MTCLCHNDWVMLKMSDDDYRRDGAKNHPDASPSSPQIETRVKNRAIGWFRDFIRGRASNSNEHLQEALEDYIEELKETDLTDTSVDNQKALITNVLKTRDLRVADVMVPRADIVAIEQDTSIEELRDLFKEKQFSRLPVYKESLDHIIGTIHIKDILGYLLNGQPCHLPDIVREALIVSPGIPLMDLFVMMREDKKHIALVLDEHGGIDGLVTMTDVIESIVGDIEDEFDHEEHPRVVEKPDGSIIADARMDIDEFEDRYGNFLNAEEREDIETLGGLAFSIAGHVPQKGERLKHASGMVLEILEADGRRVNLVRIRNLPGPQSSDEV